jgi:hypothetical protein
MIVEIAAGHIHLVLGAQLGAVQPEAEAQWIIRHIEQIDPADGVGEIERVNIRPGGKAARATLGEPILIEPPQAVVLDGFQDLVQDASPPDS